VSDNTIYREVINEHGKALIPEGSPLDTLADDLADKRNLLDLASDAEKAARRDVERAEAALFDAMEAQNLRAIRTPRGLFSLNDQAWASVVDEAAAREWAEANLPEIISLNRSRLSVVVRTAIKEGMALPPGVDFTTSRKITWRRS